MLFYFYVPRILHVGPCKINCILLHFHENWDTSENGFSVLILKSEADSNCAELNSSNKLNDFVFAKLRFLNIVYLSLLSDKMKSLYHNNIIYNSIITYINDRHYFSIFLNFPSGSWHQFRCLLRFILSPPTLPQLSAICNSTNWNGPSCGRRVIYNQAPYWTVGSPRGARTPACFLDLRGDGGRERRSSSPPLYIGSFRLVFRV